MEEIYKQIRHKNRLLRQEKIDKVFAEYPRVKDIKSEIASFAVQNTLAILQNPDKTAVYSAALKNFNDQKLAEISKILEGSSHSLDFDKEIFDCPKCQDQGLLKDGSHCPCSFKKMYEIRAKGFNLDKLERENFATFDINVFPDGQERYTKDHLTQRELSKKNYKKALDFTMAFPKTKSLLMFGDPGLGKTFLSNCIAKSILDKGYRLVYETATELANQVYEWVGKSGELPMYLSSLIDADLLIIDDFGAENVTEFWESNLFHIVNSRLLRGKPLIISTNHTLDDLHFRYHERIFSRLAFEFEILVFAGKDLRFELRK